MISVGYIHSSAFGSYIVDCTVLEKTSDESGKRYLIEFYDDVGAELSRRWVEPSALIFPKFSEYVI